MHILEPIELYQTTDNKVFENLEEAKEAQLKIDEAGLNVKLKDQVKDKLKELPKYGKFATSSKSYFSREFGKTNFTRMVFDLAINYPNQLIEVFGERPDKRA